MEETRIDKYLWAIRIFKTRSDSAEACKTSRVQLNGHPVKPSSQIKVSDIINIRKGAVRYSYKVICPVDKRQGAQSVPQYAENITPREELDKLSPPQEIIFMKRDRGTGRPTKKERRDLEKLFED